MDNATAEANKDRDFQEIHATIQQPSAGSGYSIESRGSCKYTVDKAAFIAWPVWSIRVVLENDSDSKQTSEIIISKKEAGIQVSFDCNGITYTYTGSEDKRLIPGMIKIAALCNLMNRKYKYDLTHLEYEQFKWKLYFSPQAKGKKIYVSVLFTDLNIFADLCRCVHYSYVTGPKTKYDSVPYATLDDLAAAICGHVGASLSAELQMLEAKVDRLLLSLGR